MESDPLATGLASGDFDLRPLLEMSVQERLIRYRRQCAQLPFDRTTALLESGHPLPDPLGCTGWKAVVRTASTPSAGVASQPPRRERVRHQLPNSVSVERNDER
jgi:hypothetical protein